MDKRYLVVKGDFDGMVFFIYKQDISREIRTTFYKNSRLPTIFKDKILPYHF